MKKIITVLIFLITTINLLSQDSIVMYYNKNFNGKRPKIGLVLSGGGAKGLAHIGVIKVLEKAGIKPDYITGTSMGSIVGGLYSIGFSADSMQTLMENQDWDKILSNKINLRDINMEEKWDYGEYIMEFPLVGWKPTLPKGAIKGQELELIFNKLTVSVAKDTNFNDFKIPFRAIAVDLLTGNPYVFKTGNLSVAMRASMSIPSVMDPVKYRGMLLVDGGLTDNFPVQECINMGADIIIGVYVGGSLLPEEKLNTLFELLTQSSMLAGIKKANEEKKQVDVYIEPDLEGYSASDFNSAEIISAKGFQAATKKYDEINKLALFLKQFPAPQKPNKKQLTDSVFISSQKINVDKNNPKYIKILNNSLLGSNNVWMQPDDIKKKIDHLYGTLLFDKITYSLEPSHNDTNATLEYNAKIGTNKLVFALNYNLDSKIGVIFGLKYKNVILPASKLDLKLKISEYPAFRARYFVYLGKRMKQGVSASYNFYFNNLFLYGGYDYNTANKFIKVGQEIAYYNNIQFSYYSFFNIRSSITFSLGYEYGGQKNQFADFYNNPILKQDYANCFSKISYKYNNLDKKYFSNKGSEFEINVWFNWNNTHLIYTLDSSYEKHKNIYTLFDQGTKVLISYNNFLSLNKKTVITNEASILSSYNSPNTFFIGGVNRINNIVPFWGLPTSYLEVNDNSLLIYRLGLRYNIIDKLYLTGKINSIFSPVENYYTIGGGLQASYESIIGPISITATKNINSSNIFWDLSLGFKF